MAAVYKVSGLTQEAILHDITAKLAFAYEHTYFANEGYICEKPR